MSRISPSICWSGNCSGTAVLLNPFWYGRVREAQALLHRAYKDVAQEHLEASLPADDSGQDGARHYGAPGLAGQALGFCPKPRERVFALAGDDPSRR